MSIGILAALKFITGFSILVHFLLFLQAASAEEAGGRPDGEKELFVEDQKNPHVLSRILKASADDTNKKRLQRVKVVKRHNRTSPLLLPTKRTKVGQESKFSAKPLDIIPFMIIIN